MPLSSQLVLNTCYLWHDSKTTSEVKEILAAMLGNQGALVQIFIYESCLCVRPRVLHHTELWAAVVAAIKTLQHQREPREAGETHTGLLTCKRTESLRALTAFPRLVMRNLWEAHNYFHFFVLPASFTLACYKQLRVGWEYLQIQSQEIRCRRLTVPSETSVIVGLVLKYWLLELDDFLNALFSLLFPLLFF